MRKKRISYTQAVQRTQGRIHCAQPFKKPYTYAQDAHRFIKQYHINSYLQKLKTSIHYINSYNALTSPRYSCVGERCTDGETKTLEINTPRNSP